MDVDLGHHFQVFVNPPHSFYNWWWQLQTDRDVTETSHNSEITIFGRACFSF